MSKYKMLAVDLDGTLLRTDKSISPNTIEAIKKMIDLGYIFVISTGRAYVATKQFINLIDRKISTILLNGSEVLLADGTKIANIKLTDSQVSRVVSKINENNGSFVFCSNGNLFCSKEDPYSDFYRKVSKVEVPVYKKSDLVDVSKIIWFDTKENHEIHKNELREDFSDLSFQISQPTFLEFVQKGISKGEAIKTLAKYYNISLDEVISIGDSENDLEMIKVSGLGVAMDNASDYVKSFADIITSSNDLDGVRKIIEKYFIN